MNKSANAFRTKDTAKFLAKKKKSVDLDSKQYKLVN